MMPREAQSVSVALRPLNSARSRQRSGIAATELAVVLPLLMLVVLGCVDFGRVVYESIALNNAVGAGAAYAATHRFTDFSRPTWEARVRETVLEEMQHVPDFDAEAIVIGVDASSDDGNVYVSIEASYPFRTVVEWPGLPHEVYLRQRVESQQYR